MAGVSDGRESPHDETAIVERVRRGDREAFGILVDTYTDQALGVAFGYLRQIEDAEDLVQDAFVRALERLDRLAPGSAFGPWFYRLLVNAAINRRKYLARRQTGELPRSVEAADNPAADSERAHLRRRLAEALARLPTDLHTVVVLHDLEGFTHPEIAEILEIPEGTCRSHLSRARRLLRQVLEEYQQQG